MRAGHRRRRRPTSSRSNEVDVGLNPLVILRLRRAARRELATQLAGARAAFRVLELAVADLANDRSRREVRVAAIAIEGAAVDLALRVIWLTAAAGRVDAVGSVVDFAMVDPVSPYDE